MDRPEGPGGAGQGKEKLGRGDPVTLEEAGKWVVPEGRAETLLWLRRP